MYSTTFDTSLSVIFVWLIVIVTLNGSEFSISSFAFNDFESTSMIYFHCNVNVCNEETEGDGSCDVSCEGGGRRRRTVGAGIDAVQMTVGPIRIEK